MIYPTTKKRTFTIAAPSRETKNKSKYAPGGSGTPRAPLAPEKPPRARPAPDSPQFPPGVKKKFAIAAPFKEHKNGIKICAGEYWDPGPPLAPEKPPRALLAPEKTTRAPLAP